MEELVYPIYAIEYFGTYCDAVWMYEEGGIDRSFTTENPGETKAIFVYEEDARDYFKKHKLNKMDFWDPMDYAPDSPDVGIGYYGLVKYTDDWNDSGKVLEKSSIGITARQLRNMFKKYSGIDLKELSEKKNVQNSTSNTGI